MSKTLELELLEKLTLPQLRRLCEDQKLGVTVGRKKEAVQAVMDAIKEKGIRTGRFIKLIPNYAEEKPKVRKTAREESPLDKLFKKTCNVLKRFDHAKYGKITEKEIEMQLLQALRHGLPVNYRKKVTYEKEYGKGKRLDIAIDNQVGVELKYSPIPSQLDRLVGQVLRYLEGGTYKRIAVLIVGGEGSRVEVLEEYKKRIESSRPGKIRVVIV